MTTYILITIAAGLVGFVIGDVSGYRAGFNEAVREVSAMLDDPLTHRLK